MQFFFSSAFIININCEASKWDRVCTMWRCQEMIFSLAILKYCWTVFTITIASFQCKFPSRLYVCRLKSNWRRLIWFHSIHFVKSFFAFCSFFLSTLLFLLALCCCVSNRAIVETKSKAKFFTISRNKRNFSFFFTTLESSPSSIRSIF